jgi:hypothetical protein
VNFVELNVYGVLISPLAAIMTVAFLVLILLRRFIAATGLSRHIWHPALFDVSLYLIILSSLVMATW